MYRYVGTGFLPDVPARDISDAEARERGIEEVLRACRDYEYVPDRVSARGGRTLLAGGGDGDGDGGPAEGQQTREEE